MIRLENLTLGYGSRILLDRISAGFRDSRLVALLGRNGTGKSTLLRAIAGLETIRSGNVFLCGKRADSLTAAEAARIISFVTTDKIRVPHLKCRDVVALGRAPYTDWIGRMRERDRMLIDRALETVGMSAYADSTLDRMSDGECQRVMIARALAQDTPVILLDEPTSFLDLPNRYELGLLLRRLAHEQHKCILFSTHELDIALSLCDSIALIDNPRLWHEDTPDMVRSGNIERLFRNDSVSFDAQRQRVRLKK